MNIDDGHRILVDEVSRKHLHVAGEHHDVDVVGGQELELLLLGSRLVVLCHGNKMERHAIKIGMPPGVGMIADHQREIAREFSVSLAIEEIDEAVIDRKST